ncbi:nod factor export ATP-binding protein [Pseudozyma hubeiensis SY62]|uniref:Nod factor export ATP-binding protein n=1 Tax=Pseudozyma hubeiensis (strain SY62) TaxID=1305764 RepID=R9PMH4_PSEHS|nr:nod factor export ATP-binding protein [Pseudozyma hubeiensis SY62]GAC99300.1 nod factor export ATP-binding protein [Pseudozyma hubeiensis SY62]
MQLQRAQRCRLFRKPDFRPCEDAALNFTIPSRRGVPSSNRPRSVYNAGESDPRKEAGPIDHGDALARDEHRTRPSSDRTSTRTKAPATTAVSSELELPQAPERIPVRSCVERD